MTDADPAARANPEENPSRPPTIEVPGDPGRADWRERGIVIVLATVQFVAIVDFMVIMPLQPELARSIGLTTRTFAAVVAAYAYAAGVAGAASTLFLDRFARRPAYLALFAGFILGTAACGLAPDLATLLVARSLTGVFGGLLGGMAMTIIGDVVPEKRRGSATGILMMAFALASSFGVPIGLKLGQAYGWHAPFLTLAGLCVPFFALAAATLPRMDGHLTRRNLDESALGRLRETFLTPNHLRAFALTVALMFGGFSVVPFINPYLVANVGIPESQLYLSYIAGGLVSLVGMPVIGRLADRFGKLRVYRTLIPANAAMFLVITCLPRVGIGVVLAAVAGLMLTNGGRMVPAMAMITSGVEPRLRGGFMGANSAIQHIAAGLGTSVAGLILFQPKDGPIEHYPFVGLIAAAASLSTLWLAGRLRASTPAEAAAPVSPAHAEFA